MYPDVRSGFLLRLALAGTVLAGTVAAGASTAAMAQFSSPPPASGVLQPGSESSGPAKGDSSLFGATPMLPPGFVPPPMRPQDESAPADPPANDTGQAAETLPAPAPPPVQASIPKMARAEPSTIDRLNTYFNSIRSLTGNFVQIGPDGRRSEGEFFLHKPGKVRFDYRPPSPVELVADGASVAIRDRRLDTQDLYPLAQTPLRFLLAEKLDLARDANVVGVYQDDLFVTVVIEEDHRLVGKHRLMIMFGAEDSQLKQWTITDPQGFDTTVALFNLDRSKQPDPAIFRINYDRAMPTHN